METPANTSRSGGEPVWVPPPSTEGCSGNLGTHCSPGLWKDKFSLAKGTVSRCRHGRLFFLFPHKGCGGGRKESEKEREIKSTRVKLAQRAGFKTRDETTTPVLAARGPPSSQPGPHRARRPHRREPNPMFHKALSLRGKGHGSCLCCREFGGGLFATKQTKGIGVVTVLPPIPL